jgi:membrane protein DedA with SNARE-associated domain
MNKGMVIWLVLLLGLSYQAFAKAGAPNDGLLFELAIVGILLLLTGFFAGLEYLRKKGKNHSH